MRSWRVQAKQNVPICPKAVRQFTWISYSTKRRCKQGVQVLPEKQAGSGCPVEGCNKALVGILFRRNKNIWFMLPEKAVYIQGFQKAYRWEKSLEESVFFIQLVLCAHHSVYMRPGLLPSHSSAPTVQH